MTNPAALARQQAQAQWPGATVAERGRGHLRHQHPSNPDRYMLDTQTGARWHFGSAPYSQAQEVDTAWQPTTGAWQYEMTLNDFQTFARDTFNVGDIFEFRKGGEWVRFDPQSLNWIDENTSRQQIAIKQAVAAVVNDDTLSFPGAYGTGIDFEYQNQTSRLRKLITVDQFSRIDTTLPAGNTIWFEAEFSLSLSSGIDFYLDGQRWQRNNNQRVQTANRIEVRDAATGTQVLWWLDAPRAWDSAGSNVVGQMEVRRQGGPSSLFITVRIPKAWIDSAVFPIYVDPTIDDAVSADANDGGLRSGLGFSTSVRYLGFRSSPSFGNHETFARFTNISGLSGATIDTAYTEVATKGSGGASITMKIRAADAAAPAAPTNGSEFTGATLTTAGVDWDFTTAGSGYNTSPSIVSVIQELADDYDPSAIVIYIKNDGTTGNNYSEMADYSWGSPDKLHIEYTAGGGATINLAAIAAGQTATPSPTLAVTRPLVATIAQQTATPVASLAVTRPLVAVAAAQSATPDTTSLSVTRGLAAIIAAVTTTPAPALAITRPLAAVLGGQTATAPTALAISRPLAAILAGQTVAPDTVTLSVQALVELAATIAGQTATPAAVSLAIARPFSATVAVQSATPGTISLAVARALAAVAGVQTATPDNVALDIQGAIALAAAIAAQTATSNAGLAIARPLSALAAGQTATPDLATLVIARALAATVTAGTASPDTVALAMARALTSTMAAQSATAPSQLAVARPLTSTLAGQTATPDSVTLVTAVIVGLVSVAIAARLPGVAVAGRQPGATIDGRRPGVTFTANDG